MFNAKSDGYDKETRKHRAEAGMACALFDRWPCLTLLEFLMEKIGIEEEKRKQLMAGIESDDRPSIRK